MAHLWSQQLGGGGVRIRGSRSISAVWLVESQPGLWDTISSQYVNAVPWTHSCCCFCCNTPNISLNKTHALQNYSLKMLGSRENSMGWSEPDQLFGSWDTDGREEASFASGQLCKVLDQDTGVQDVMVCWVCFFPPISNTKLSSTQSSAQSRLTQSMLSSLQHSQGLQCSPGLGAKLELLLVKNEQF